MAGFVCMVCYKTKPALGRFSNALKINALSLHFKFWTLAFLAPFGGLGTNCLVTMGGQFYATMGLCMPFCVVTLHFVLFFTVFEAALLYCGEQTFSLSLSLFRLITKLIVDFVN